MTAKSTGLNPQRDSGGNAIFGYWRLIPALASRQAGLLRCYSPIL
jgi:hypothetical protein